LVRQELTDLYAMYSLG